MAARKKLINADKNVLGDSIAQTLLLQCLFNSAGQGTSAPELKRFINNVCPQSFSEFRLFEMLERLVKEKFINLKVMQTQGGRIYRKYEIAGTGLILLAAYSHLLPKEIKKSNAVRFMEINRIVMAEIDEQKLYNSSVMIEVNPLEGE